CITADAAIRQAMKCSSRERVLLHAAAGGVGLAAMQVLQSRGCIPIATAGSPSKRAAVRRLGCHHALNSRDASFAEGVAMLGGASALLNSMTTPGLIAASLSGLCRGARMTEIGKRDIWSPQRIAQERPDISYCLLAIDFFPPEALQASLSTGLAALSGVLSSSGMTPPVLTAVPFEWPTFLQRLGASTPEVFMEMASQIGSNKSGLDSLGAVELRNTLESVSGLQLPGTLVFDYPSTSGPAPARFGGFLCGIEAFDAKCFGVADGECYLMDPQQRLLLELSHEALLAVGRNHSNYSTQFDSRTCIAVGIASAEYNNHVVANHSPGESSYSATGASLSVASGRLAYTFGFKGATFSVDTACSSSLVGTHFVRSNLQMGTSTAALACGVGLILSPTSTAMFQKAGMLAPDGRCKTLDSSADGYVRSEAAGAMILGLLDGQHLPILSGYPLGSGDDHPLSTPQAVMMVAGSAVNQDGRSSGLTAPHGPSQQDVIRAALASSSKQGLQQRSAPEASGAVLGAVIPAPLGPFHQSSCSRLSAAKGASSGLWSMALLEDPLDFSEAAGCLSAEAQLVHAPAHGSMCHVQGLDLRPVVPVRTYGLAPTTALQTPRTPRTPSAVGTPRTPGIPGTPRTPAFPQTPRTPSFVDQPLALTTMTHLSDPLLSALPSTMDAARPPIRLAALTETVQGVVAGVLGECPAMDAPLMAAGLDSLGATELQQGINQALDLELPATLAFDYPTMEAICSAAWERIQGSTGLVVPQQSIAQDMSRDGAKMLTALWGSAGHDMRIHRECSGDSVIPVPLARWDPSVTILGAPNGSQASLASLRDASHGTPGNGGRQAATAMGVYVGVGSADYEALSRQVGVPLSAFSFSAASSSVASGRISHAFGFRGPTASIDTACSASLVATHMACGDFRDGAADGAIVAGVLLCLNGMPMTRKQRSRSPPGVGRFETKAAPLALIVATAVNTNGRSSALTAPHGPSQQSLMVAALQRGRVAPAAISGLQMHANGTPLGDPIEVAAVSAILGQVPGRSPLALATIKGFTGHQEAASGVANLLAATITASMARMPAALHLRTLNPLVAGALAGQPTRIARGGPAGMAAPIAGSTGSMQMGVNAFGAQGTNAHAIIAAGAASAVARPSATALLGGLQIKRCWITPPMQALLHRSIPAATGSAVMACFQSNLGTAAHADLWAVMINTSNPHASASPARSNHRQFPVLLPSVGACSAFAAMHQLHPGDADGCGTMALSAVTMAAANIADGSRSPGVGALMTLADSSWLAGCAYPLGPVQEERYAVDIYSAGLQANGLQLGPVTASLQVPMATDMALTAVTAQPEAPMDLVAHPLMSMPAPDRVKHIEAQVAQEVHGLMGVVPDREEPLMAAGLDSRGGFELRRALAEALSIQLPVTLLYDYQSVTAITAFIAEEPTGPFLLGGHSYGGAVAMEIAMVLESWGHTIGLVLVMDTPRPEQIRPLQPHAVAADESDVMELVEMVLGALGSDALGLGEGMAHPARSEEWQALSAEERMEFFAPIWRIMRDDNMTAAQVREQVEQVALAVKIGSEVSDLRHHTYLAPCLQTGKVVYFRAETAGACTYFDDRPDGPMPHGHTWRDLCSALEVVDVPGDHFSLLRQSPEDMQVMVRALQAALGPFGWQQLEQMASSAIRPAAENGMGGGEDLETYLEKMGVENVALRRRVAEGVAMPMQASLPKPAALTVKAEELGAGLPGKDGTLRPILLLCDAASFSMHDALFRAFAEGPRHCFMLQLPNTVVLEEAGTAAALVDQHYMPALKAHGWAAEGCIVAAAAIQPATGASVPAATRRPGLIVPIPAGSGRHRQLQKRNQDSNSMASGPLEEWVNVGSIPEWAQSMGSRLPAWVMHDERGVIGLQMQQLASTLLMPCYGVVMPAETQQVPDLQHLALQYAAEIVSLQPTGPHLLIGSGLGSSLVATAVAHALTTVGHKPLLVLINAPAELVSQAAMHDLAWNALYHLIRDMGSFNGSLGDLMAILRQSSSASQQLQLLIRYKPAEVAADAWDTAIYGALARARELRRLGQEMRGSAEQAFFAQVTAAVAQQGSMPGQSQRLLMTPTPGSAAAFTRPNGLLGVLSLFTGAEHGTDAAAANVAHMLQSLMWL
ncbi:hypothetical protein WJX84_009188, partial [Apatococcus fuscideae]